MSDTPANSHFAIIEHDSITISGDERSRTNPGHGYPESTEAVIRYHVFHDKAKLIEWIERHPHARFEAIQAIPLTVTKTTQVHIKGEERY